MDPISCLHTVGSMPVQHSVLNVKAVVAAFNQEKALVGAFSVITNLWMELFEALIQWNLVLQKVPSEGSYSRRRPVRL